MYKYFHFLIFSYIFSIILICVGIYSLWDTIKRPIPNNEKSPLQGNKSGYVFGVSSIFFGIVILTGKFLNKW